MLRRSTRKYLKYILLASLSLYGTFSLLKLSFGSDKTYNNLFKNDNSNLEKQVVDKNAMIDWHDYGLIETESKQSGPGEQGKAYQPSDLDKDEVKKLYSVNGFNAAASRRIAVNRSLSDIRHPGCKTMKYLKNLPLVSVVVPFHNEDNSTLIRTATSVITRSPSHLIHEVILVDDFSNKDVLRAPLEEYLKKYLPKVRVVRASKREGLIRARLLGAKAASGEVLIFLDSHTEASTNWLPPLLDPIARNMKTVVCPFIDVIDYETFAYRAQDEGARGAFDWELYYKRLPLLPDDLKHPTRPFKSPVMAGGLFAINREWFWMLGGYDEGLDIWGAEQYELSFKIWQCGGDMVDAPCSRVGHIYRKFAPFPNPGIGDFLSKNFKRLILAWMDEYGEFIYKRKPHLRTVDAGDLSKPRAIREKLKCKPFSWFMKEVAFDLEKKFPALEPPPYGGGEIRSFSDKTLCMDTKFKQEHDRFSLQPCMKDENGRPGEQYFELTWHKDIKPRGRHVCFDVSSSVDQAPVILYNCHGGQGNQMFKFLVDSKQLYHKVSNHCLDCDTGRKELFMRKCDSSSPTQKWLIEKVDEKALANYDKSLVK